MLRMEAQPNMALEELVYFRQIEMVIHEITFKIFNSK